MVSNEVCPVEFRGKSYGCHLEVTLDLIGGKWKSLLLWHLGQNEVLRFGALRRIHPKLTEKMLAQQLKELEADGLVSRKMYNQIPPKVEYRLTDRGRALGPVLDTMITWGKAYVGQESALTN